MIGSNYRQFLGIHSCYFKNIKEEPDKTNRVYCLFNINSPNYESRKNFMRNHNLYIGEYEYENYHMFVMKVPDEFKKDYYYFTQGKYSLFSDLYKGHVVSFFSNYTAPYFIDGDPLNHKAENIISYNTYVKYVLYRPERFYEILENIIDVDINRDQELASKPEGKDIFDSDTIDKLNNKDYPVKEWI